MLDSQQVANIFAQRDSGAAQEIAFFFFPPQPQQCGDLTVTAQVSNLRPVGQITAIREEQMLRAIRS